MIKQIKKELKIFKKKREALKIAPMVYSALSAKIPYNVVKENFRLSEDNFKDYLSTITQSHALLDLEQLNFILTIRNLNNGLIDILIKNFAYPFLIFGVNFVLSYFFSFKFAPTINEISTTSTIQIKLLGIFTFIIKAILSIKLIIISAILLCLIFLFKKENRITLFIMLHDKRGFSLLKDIVSLRFVYCLDYLQQYNLPTNEIIKRLRNLNEMIDVSWLSFHIHDRLSSGIPLLKSIDLSYLNPMFIFLFKQGILTKTLDTSFKSIKSYLKDEIKLKIMRLSKIFKLISYLYLINLIFVFYNYLFIPIQLMEGLL